MRNIKSVCIMLLKMIGYTKIFNETKYMSFLLKDDELLGKYNKISDEVRNSIKKDLTVNQYAMKIIQLKESLMKEKISTHFHNIRMPKESSHCICLSVILIDPVLKTDENYYPRVFLKEYKLKWLVEYMKNYSKIKKNKD